MLQIGVPKQQRMRKLDEAELGQYAAKIQASPYPNCRHWWVCEFGRGDEWEIVAAYPIHMGDEMQQMAACGFPPHA